MKKINALSIIALLLAITHSHAQTCNANITRSAPDSRYQLVNDNTEVKDTQTGLIWQRCSLGQTWNGTSCISDAVIYNWADALQAAKNIGSGWRVPNIKELDSLIEQACYSPSINEVFFPNTQSGSYWSSSLVTSDGHYALVVGFTYGSDGSAAKDGSRYVRLVRSE